MLTSVDIVGHLASGVWSLDRFICFSFADLILIQFERSRGECVPRATLEFSHGKDMCLNFILIALGVDKCTLYVGSACSIVIGVAGQNGIS